MPILMNHTGEWAYNIPLEHTVQNIAPSWSPTWEFAPEIRKQIRLSIPNHIFHRQYSRTFRLTTHELVVYLGVQGYNISMMSPLENVASYLSQYCAEWEDYVWLKSSYCTSFGMEIIIFRDESLATMLALGGEMQAISLDGLV